MKNLLLFTLSVLATWTLKAQASGESIYSQQNFDPATTEAWYQSPFIITAFVLLIGTGGYLWYKGRTR